LESEKTILNKLRLLTIVPGVVIVTIFTIFILYTYHNLTTLKILSSNVAKIEKSANLINELQRERGISSGYLGSKGKIFKDSLIQQRQKTDKAFQELLNLENKNRDTFIQNQLALIQMRKEVTLLKVSVFHSFNYYTYLISHIQNNFLDISTLITDFSVKNLFQAFINLSLMKESLGELRGGINGVLSQKQNTSQLNYITISAKATYQLSEKRFYRTASSNFLEQYNSIVKSENYQNLAHNILLYTNNNLKNSYFEEPIKWYAESTNIINQLYDIETAYMYSINNYVQTSYHNEKSRAIIILLLFTITTFFNIWLSLKIKRNIKANIKLLNEYKSAVDRSTIVSKTDKKGIVTYVNEEFCSISGYSQEELIGKPHNIVRHSDMSVEAFKDMWQTILSKKSWSGIVKNRKKDGTSYTVEATISPILNSDGEIEEFIAIRNDITDILNLHKEIEHTQSDLIFRMGEIGETRSKETGHHVKRVAKYSQLLAKYYGMSNKEIEYLVSASPMHDIGKVGIPDAILNKAGKLTKTEWSIMKTHATIGYELFRDSDKPLLQTASIIAHQHHEKYDGSGYPRGLSGKNIHIYGRITAVADVFDALGSDRCYKKAWEDEKIFELLKEERGKHFDPQLVDIFFEHLEEFLEIRDYFSDQSSAMKSE